MKKILVTGADGFIGSHLVERLVDEGGCRINAFACYNFSNSWGWLDTLPRNKMKNVSVFTGDIRDMATLKKAMDGADKVFHLAALIGIPYSYSAPYSYVETNINGTLNVLEAARAVSVGKVLVTSTSEVYGTAVYSPIDEKHPKQGQSPYSASKIGADYMAQAFHRSFGLPVVIVRPFNTYGPRQSARAIIPTIITQLMSGNSKIMLGSLSPKRDFVYVKDTVEGFVRLSRSEKAVGEEVNIATRREIGIGSLARLIISVMGKKAVLALDSERVRPESSEVERLCGDNRKLYRLTGWKPSYELEDGITETVEWFRDNARHHLYKPGIYNV